jgi:hypothetical protein
MIAVIAVETGHGTEPDEALLVAIHTGDLVMRKALGDIETGEMKRSGLTVERVGVEHTQTYNQQYERSGRHNGFLQNTLNFTEADGEGYDYQEKKTETVDPAVPDEIPGPTGFVAQIAQEYIPFCGWMPGGNFGYGVQRFIPETGIGYVD